jgi:plasmid stabilization system protein ParE
MVKEIIWSPTCHRNFNTIINYLLGNFGEASAKKFVQNVDAKVALIIIRPKMFRPLIKGLILI